MDNFKEASTTWRILGPVRESIIKQFREEFKSLCDPYPPEEEKRIDMLYRGRHILILFKILITQGCMSISFYDENPYQKITSKPIPELSMLLHIKERKTPESPIELEGLSSPNLCFPIEETARLAYENFRCYFINDTFFRLTRPS